MAKAVRGKKSSRRQFILQARDATTRLWPSIAPLCLKHYLKASCLDMKREPSPAPTEEERCEGSNATGHAKTYALRLAGKRSGTGEHIRVRCGHDPAGYDYRGRCPADEEFISFRESRGFEPADEHRSERTSQILQGSQV